MTTTTTKKRTITLTDRPPVTIDEVAWPIVAHSSGRSRVCYSTPIPDYETDGYDLRVRQHANGRAIVYAVLDAASAWTHSEDRREGELLASGGDLAAAIRRVGSRCGLPDTVIRDAIADLPAEEIE